MFSPEPPVQFLLRLEGLAATNNFSQSINGGMIATPTLFNSSASGRSNRQHSVYLYCMLLHYL